MTGKLVDFKNSVISHNDSVVSTSFSVQCNTYRQNCSQSILYCNFRFHLYVKMLVEKSVDSNNTVTPRPVPVFLTRCRNGA